MTAIPLVDLNTLELPDLFAALNRKGLVERLIALARDEDLGQPPTDVTTWALAPSDRRIETEVVARQPGVLAGLAAMPLLLDAMAPQCAFAPCATDGDQLTGGQCVARLAGPASQILILERTLLNLLGRLSGVATNVAKYVAAISESSAQLFDTRKTTPGMRALEKYAVRCGGGYCHRAGLYDAVLIKDNHLAGIDTDQLKDRLMQIVSRARSGPPIRFVEVEVDSIEQLTEALTIEHGLINIILLDNFTADELRDAVSRRDASNPALLLEASGGVTLETIGAIAKTGVERISSGALTHGATWLDFGLDATI